MLGSFTTPRGATVTCEYREGTNDWNTLTSCLTEDEYGLADRFLTGVALDVGAYIGGVSIALAVDNPDLLVVAVEPVRANRYLLHTNAHMNGVADRVQVMPVAVGAPGELTTQLHVNFRGDEIAEHHAFVGTTENGGSAEEWRLGSGHDVIEVLTVAARELLDGTPSFVKIDCEGGEYAFLQDRTVDGWPLIVGEWHNAGGRTRADLLALLPAHDVTFTGPEAGPGGFVAVRR